MAHQLSLSLINTARDVGSALTEGAFKRLRAFFHAVNNYAPVIQRRQEISASTLPIKHLCMRTNSQPW